MKNFYSLCIELSDAVREFERCEYNVKFAKDLILKNEQLIEGSFDKAKRDLKNSQDRLEKAKSDMRAALN